LKVAVAFSFVVIVMEHGFVLGGVRQPAQPPNVDEPVGVAVRVTVELIGNRAEQTPAELAQLRPAGLLVMFPVPAPAKVTVRAGPLPVPPPVKQTTFPVIYPVTIAPEDEMPPALELVLRVAETRVPPQLNPVTFNSPEELTVIICGVFEAQVT
jgi:hypothetical protein